MWQILKGWEQWWSSYLNHKRLNIYKGKNRGLGKENSKMADNNSKLRSDKERAILWVKKLQYWVMEWN